ncbi:hypothetical protein DYB25_004844 [Aphanomyces astaci]|nr:hypothetical protein DYB25_004844 [Aphanomyces astaci]RHY68528.1 hypothetical protein DYB34_014096 [Aphanomyces astaci]RHY75486.1 hypothetical protein DYB38_013670 [Aphanomyces astaci]RHY77565.1 hypothetical protein DYB30_011889 [Aphanomyces astaci]RHY95673.1 hypothetical protein DYB35_011679 [Aphanomyces astaci]
MHKLLVNTTDLNPHFICTLCHGYFRQPYTIRECIHTFCKSCIFKYIVSGVGNQCPICQLEFGTYPLQDHVMEGLVKKLFPQLDLQDKEDEEQFYAELEFDPRNGSAVTLGKDAKFKRMGGPLVKMIMRPVKRKNVVMDLGEIQIRCKDKILGKEHSLQFIQRTMWKKDAPIQMEYRRVDATSKTLEPFGGPDAERDI